MAERPTFRQVALGTPYGFIASGFGSGLAPKAPGTVGSLAALPLWWLLAPLPIWLYALAILLALGVGVWAAGRTGLAVGVADHGGIVWDEFVGLWIALAAIPMQWPWILAGFALFRILDIAKPPPIRQLERSLPGGAGVMMDDVAAGLMALGILQGAAYWSGM